MAAPLRLVASSAFGIEAVVRRELSWMGLEASIPTPGRVVFDGEPADIARANLWLRSASRVMVELASFAAPEFDALYEGVRGVAWGDLLPARAAIGVRVRAARSAINSPRSAQSIVKRAVIDTLAGKGGRVEEDGPGVLIDVAVLSDHATVSLDTSGPGLHKRGYRPRSGPGQLKETLAAAIVHLTGWRGDRPLLDPFCGQGTIVIEAALIAAGLAPGAQRTFAGEVLPWIDAGAWREQRERAEQVQRPAGLPQILGRDISDRAVGEARRAAERAGVKGLVGFRLGDYHDLVRPSDRGWVITNPPCGLRVLDEAAAREIHLELPGVLSGLPGWSHAVLTAFEGFEALIRQSADRRRKLYNGSIKAGLYIFTPRRDESGRAKQAFGDTSDRDSIAETFRVTLRKRVRHLRRWADRGIEAYRVYDGQTPGAPLLIDRYGEHLHIAEMARRSERPVGEDTAWLRRLMDIVAEETCVPAELTHTKLRRRQRAGFQYGTVDGGRPFAVVEHGLRFEVELDARLDTGLFIDHRQTRQLVRRWAQGRRVLNLFCYTGSFTVAAAAGGAESTVSVDLSRVYLDWAGRNLAQNALAGGRHQLVQEDAVRYVRTAGATGAGTGAGGRRFDLIVLDPPTFSNSKRTPTVFDVQRDHAEFIPRVLGLLAPGGRLVFSTNKRRFKLDASVAALAGCREITGRTVPEDYTRSRPHRCWVIDAAGDRLAPAAEERS